MHQSLINLLAGAVLVFAVLGLGKLALRLLNLSALPWYWNLAFTAILGQTAVNLLVQALLLSGASSVSRLKLLGWLAIVLGLCGHLLNLKKGATGPRPRPFRKFPGNKFLKALLILAWITNLAAALAPSSKIDELHYDMVVPKRIAADGRLIFYRFPIEGTIMPQMQYQISLSPANALGAPEAGNVLSLGYSIILGLFVIGFIGDATESGSLALLAGLGCAVGVYHTLWNTTEGTAALGELALAVSLCGLLWPGTLMEEAKPFRYALLIVTAASLAASSKISLLPLCAIVSLFACWRICPPKYAVKIPAVFGALLIPWIVIHGPLMLWTYFESGSFWGPVLANLFHPSIFTPAQLHIIKEFQVENQKGFVLNVLYAAVELPLLIFAGLVFLILAAFRFREKDKSAWILALLVFQAILIWRLLPYDFRFMGGLIYIPLIWSALQLKDSNAEAANASLAPLGQRIVCLRNWIALFCVVPWLAFQLYFARPFVEVAAGWMSRPDFRERYIALNHDYQVLDRILPADAVLYFGNGRFSLFDAPRPVVETPLDLRQESSIYRLTLIDMPDAVAFKPGSVLNCDRVVYENDQAVIEAYRQRWKTNNIGRVVVKACQIQPR